MVVHAVLHLVSQVSVQVVTGVEVHIVEQVVVKSTGVHCEVHDSPVSKWQVLGSTIVTTVPLLVVHVVLEARASDAESRGAEEGERAERRYSEKKRFMGSFSGTKQRRMAARAARHRDRCSRLVLLPTVAVATPRVAAGRWSSIRMPPLRLTHFRASSGACDLRRAVSEEPQASRSYPQARHRW